MKRKLSSIMLLLLIALTACTSHQGRIKYFYKVPYTKVEPYAPILFVTLSVEVGSITVTANDIKMLAIGLDEPELAGAVTNNVGYTFALLDEEDGCGPSRLEMVNIAKDESAKQQAPWNKTGPLFYVESGFNAMRWQNGVCETIRNPRSDATCMGQFLYAYHNQRDWARIQNATGEYSNHVWCINQAITYLREEADAGIAKNVNRWAGWDPYWDAAVYRYKGCWHPAATNNGRNDCDVWRSVELAGGFYYGEANTFVSFAENAVNECWDFELNQWITIDRTQGQTCYEKNLKVMQNVQ